MKGASGFRMMMGLTVLILLGACGGSHTPFVNQNARATATNGDPAAVSIEGAPTGQEPVKTKQFVHPSYTGGTRYPFLRQEGQKIPIVFPGHDPGSAYLMLAGNRIRITNGDAVTKPPHDGTEFDPGKVTEPSAADPFTTIRGDDARSALSFGLGPVQGAEVQGYCTTDSCRRERFFLLTYDDGMEARLAKAALFPWDEIRESDWNAYLLTPRFERFLQAEPAPLEFGRAGEFRMDRPGSGAAWLPRVEVTETQPVNAVSDGRSIRVYRLMDGEALLLVGMIRDDSNGSEIWFFAHPSSSEAAGR